MDCTDFVARLATVAEQGAWAIFAWGLLPNHAHLLVRAGLAFLWLDVLGHAGRALAPALGVHPRAIPKAARRGAIAVAEWRRLFSLTKES